MDCLEAIKRYIAYLTHIKRASEHTIRGYQTDLDLFTEFLQDHKYSLLLSEIDRVKIRLFLSHLYEQKKSKTTIEKGS